MNEFYAYNGMFDKIEQVITIEEVVYSASEQWPNNLILDGNDEDQQINSLNINVIASEPSSHTIHNYKSWIERRCYTMD